VNGIDYALRRVHGGENEIVGLLLRLAERHGADHEVHHVARDLARWSEEHVRLIAERAEDFGVELDADADEPSAAAAKLRSALGSAVGRRPEAGLLLLEELTRVYLRAAENSVAWQLVAQVAQAKKQTSLLELAATCHPRNLRQLRWANTMIKVQAPQILASL
jgi:hypothetical protein